MTTPIGYYKKPGLSLLTDLINRSQELGGYVKIKESDIVEIGPYLANDRDNANTRVVLQLRHPSASGVTNCGRTIKPAKPISDRTISLYYHRPTLAEYLTKTYGGNVVVPAVDDDDNVDIDMILPWLTETYQFDTTDADVRWNDTDGHWHIDFPDAHPVWRAGATFQLGKAGDIRSLITQQIVPYLTLQDLVTDKPMKPVAQLLPNRKLYPLSLIHI